MRVLHFTINKYRLVNQFLEIVISSLGILLVIFLDNPNTSLPILSYYIIGISLYLIFKVRKNSYLVLLFGIITYINVSLVLGDLLQIGQVLLKSSLLWQQSVRSSEYLILGGKGLVLLLSVLNLILNITFVERHIDKENNKIVKKNNPLIFYFGLLIMIIFLLTGYTSPVGSTYESNTRTLYEYCLLLFIVVWYYSGNSKYKEWLLILFGIVYILQALYRGDRSSAFPMITLLVLIKNIKITIPRIFSLSILGIIFSNLVSTYRQGFSLDGLTSAYFDTFGLSALLSDTVSQSYYTAISIMKVGDTLPDTWKYFFNFVAGIFLGGNFPNADVGAMSNNILFNRGGGLYFSWFYFWFGMLGIVFGALSLGIIIRAFFNKDNNIPKIFQLALVTMSFRWYLYTPFVFFRSVLFIFTSLFLVSKLVDKYVSVGKKRKNFEK